MNKELLGKIVKVVMDRPLGTKHPKHGFVYETNYGYIPNTICDEQIRALTEFQEQWFKSEIIRL